MSVKFLLLFILNFGHLCSIVTGKNNYNPQISGIIFNNSPDKKPDSAVVLLHGYGDTAENFLMVGALLSEFLPNTLFVALNAPFECKNIPFTKQWLLSHKNNPSQQLEELQKLTPAIQKYLNKVLTKYNLSFQNLAFFGFSQGAKVALNLGLYTPKCVCVVACSGEYLHNPKNNILNKLPILIIHGDADQKAPVSLAKESYKKLYALNIPVNLEILPKFGHDITPQGVALAGGFLQKFFNTSKLNKK